MPNTPALVGQGPRRSPAVRRRARTIWRGPSGILGAVGIVERVAEHHLDAVTALTGSGPAYLFLVAEALIDAGVAAGLPRPLASTLTTQLFVGSSALLAERGDPAALRAMVTSPAGTTAAGLQVLEAHAVRSALAEAVGRGGRAQRRAGLVRRWCAERTDVRNVNYATVFPDVTLFSRRATA